jgi:hypothetical protein
MDNSKDESKETGSTSVLPPHVENLISVQDNPSYVYLIRVPIWIAAFLAERTLEDFLNINLWFGVGFIVSLVSTFIIEAIRNRIIGSDTELRVGQWLYNQVPLLVAAGLIYLFIWRYLKDLQQP